MPRPWPIVLRIVVSAGFVSLLFWPVADYKWTLFEVRAYDPVTGANPVYVSAPVSDVTAFVAAYTWRISVALPEAVLGSVVAIGVFSLLGRWAGAVDRRETLCRRCGLVLRGLSDPSCPMCGAQGR